MVENACQAIDLASQHPGVEAAPKQTWSFCLPPFCWHTCLMHGPRSKAGQVVPGKRSTSKLKCTSLALAQKKSWGEEKADQQSSCNPG